MSGFETDFTVLIAVYRGDDPALFAKAMTSVFANTLPPTRTVLVVDGPVPDALDAVIGDFATRDDLTVAQLPRNMGLAQALNHGLDLITTSWTVRADADDINDAGRFAALADAIVKAQPDLAILGSAIKEVAQDGTVLAMRQPPLAHDAIRQFARRRNPFNHMTVAFRTDAAKRAGGYPDIHLKEDYALWAQMLANGAGAANLPQSLVTATTGRDMYNRRGGLRYARAEVQLQMHLVRCGLKGRTSAVVDGLLRSAIFLAPTGLRALVYRKFLRHDA